MVRHNERLYHRQRSAACLSINGSTRIHVLRVNFNILYMKNGGWSESWLWCSGWMEGVVDG